MYPRVHTYTTYVLKYVENMEINYTRPEDRPLGAPFRQLVLTRPWPLPTQYTSIVVDTTFLVG